MHPVAVTRGAALPRLPPRPALTCRARGWCVLARSPGGCAPRAARAQHRRLWQALSRCSASELQLKHQRLTQFETTETSHEALLQLVYDASGAHAARRGAGLRAPC
jgi:hypothetical protein